MIDMPLYVPSSPPPPMSLICLMVAPARESAASLQASRIALEVADGAVQVLGGYGYIRDYLPEMQLRNARGFAAFEALTLV